MSGRADEPQAEGGSEMTPMSRPAKGVVARFRDAWRGLPHSPRSKCFIVGVGAALYSGAAHILTLIALYAPPAGRSYAELNVMNPLYGSPGLGLGRSGATGVGGAAHFHTALPPLHILLLFALQPLMVGVVAAAAEYMVAGTGGLLRWWMLADAFADTLTLLFNSTNVSLAAFTLIVAGSSADYAIRLWRGAGRRAHSYQQYSGR